MASSGASVSSESAETVSTTATTTPHPPPLVLDEKRLEVITIEGSTDRVVSGDYSYVHTIRGLTGYSPVFRNIQSGAFLQRNVDNDNTTWKVWHPSHSGGWSLYYAWSSPAKEPYLPPLSGWTKHKSAGEGSLTFTIRIAPVSSVVDSALLAAKTESSTPTVAGVMAGDSGAIADDAFAKATTVVAEAVTVSEDQGASAKDQRVEEHGELPTTAAKIGSSSAVTGTASAPSAGRVSRTSLKKGESKLASAGRVSGTGSSALSGAAEVKRSLV